MTSIVLTVLLGIGGTPAGSIVPPMEDRAQPPIVSIEGDWIVVSAEKNGQPLTGMVHAAVTARDNVLTFATDMQNVTAMRLDFGPAGTIRVLELSGKGFTKLFSAQERSGVYVLTGDFLAISIHGDDGDSNLTQNQGKRTVVKPTCTFILQRSDVAHRP